MPLDRDAGRQRTREHNESIAAEAHDPDEPLAIRCECGELACGDWLVLKKGEYDEFAATEGQYAVSFGHETTGERIIRLSARHVIVEP
jgi:hypothetical protein